MTKDILNTPVPVEMDKPRAFQFNMNAQIAFEDRSGMTMLPVLVNMSRGEIPPMRVLLLLTWSGLILNDPALTPEQLGTWLTMRRFNQVAPAFRAALAQYLPELEATDVTDPQTAPANSSEASTGAESGSSELSTSASNPVG